MEILLGDVLALVLDPHAAILYAGTETGVFRSDDGGDSWMPAGLAGREVHDLAIDVLGSEPAGVLVPMTHRGARILSPTEAA